MKEESTVFLQIDFSIISDINKGDKNKEPNTELSKIRVILMTCRKNFFCCINARKKLFNRPRHDT